MGVKDTLAVKLIVGVFVGPRLRVLRALSVAVAVEVPEVEEEEDAQALALELKLADAVPLGDILEVGEGREEGDALPPTPAPAPPLALAAILPVGEPPAPLRLALALPDCVPPAPPSPPAPAPVPLGHWDPDMLCVREAAV
jgi:hypothetical protein